MLKWVAAVVLCSVVSVGLVAQPLPEFSLAQVVRVHDGDSVWLQPLGAVAKQAKAKWVVRIHGIDAPEICQDFGVQAQNALAVRLAGQRIAVTWRGQDSYGRWLASLRVLDTDDMPDVGQWMVAKGYAWSYRFKGDPGPYAQTQRLAQAQQRGLFANSLAVNPRRFRRSHGACRWAP